MVKSRYIGDGRTTFNRNPYNGYINPYYWVDDHPLLYGHNGSLDPGTFVSNGVKRFVKLNDEKTARCVPYFKGSHGIRCDLATSCGRGTFPPLPCKACERSSLSCFKLLISQTKCDIVSLISNQQIHGEPGVSTKN